MPLKIKTLRCTPKATPIQYTPEAQRTQPTGKAFKRHFNNEHTPYNPIFGSLNNLSINNNQKYNYFHIPPLRI